jgi:hypothetical protein
VRPRPSKLRVNKRWRFALVFFPGLSGLEELCRASGAGAGKNFKLKISNGGNGKGAGETPAVRKAKAKIKSRREKLPPLRGGAAIANGKGASEIAMVRNQRRK